MPEQYIVADENSAPVGAASRHRVDHALGCEAVAIRNRRTRSYDCQHTTHSTERLHAHELVYSSSVHVQRCVTNPTNLLPLPFRETVLVW